MNKLLTLCFFLLLTWPSMGQTEDEIISVVDSTLSLISGTPEDTYDWDAFRSLFTDDAELATIHLPPNAESPQLFRLTIGDFIERMGRVYESRTFIEKSIAHEVHMVKNIAQVWQTYVTYGENGEELSRGVNAYHLMKIDGNWKISSLMWEDL
ncbi:nuclear transport factor 2 family protein [Phaeocystidibacter marisrubri]|uniref:Nuclear transport factor 2 family protein n=1 Tax=Phaeocystidibacter marisrubri TaxID=1577780 RepID=A0A6L3ZGP7_9FLAO|nr:hypothetical protein [Phaeocystidibacter marisrubri]KAB2816632.1 hypothetical protein F8C82_13205 [Phaeocystidibacter marisrubri]GGH70044.1 hypothetical protein GCM10011318_11700 [Phaeocystidibacter marisrubri]